MLIFSLFCLLRSIHATSAKRNIDQLGGLFNHAQTVLGEEKTSAFTNTEPVETASSIGILKMDHVNYRIYKTKPPLQIAGFGRSADEAGKYAGILHANNQTSGTSAIEVNRRVGNHDILRAYQTPGGWIVYHSEPKTGRTFISYVVSVETTWSVLEATISETLTQFMRHYAFAFPPATARRHIAPVTYTEEQKMQAIGDFARCCEQGTLSNHDDLVRIINNLENEWLKANTPLSKKYLMAYRPSGTDGGSELPRIVKAVKDLSALEQVRKFYEILQQSKVYEYKSNGAWGVNNCMFAAILHHPEVIKDIVTFFGAKEKLSPEDLQFATETATGGKTLRRIVCQWILDNMQHVLFERTEGTPKLTVEDVVRSIGMQQDAFNPTAYITALKGGTQFIDEEISVIISVLIGRPIVVATEAEKGILTSRLMDTILSRRTWAKTAIFLHNDSTASLLLGYSGRHYSGLGLVP